MNARTPDIGDFVRDRFGQFGIVHQLKDPPPKGWIDEHLHSEELKKLGPVNWWGILSMKGRYLRVAEPMVTFVRRATYEDFLAVADVANVAGQKSLLAIFPDYVDRLLREKQFGAPP